MSPGVWTYFVFIMTHFQHQGLKQQQLKGDETSKDRNRSALMLNSWQTKATRWQWDLPVDANSCRQKTLREIWLHIQTFSFFTQISGVSTLRHSNLCQVFGFTKHVKSWTPKFLRLWALTFCNCLTCMILSWINPCRYYSFKAWFCWLTASSC